METTNHMHDTNTTGKRNGILYTIMLIAAIAVIIFSVIGIATMTGVLPSALSKNEQAAPESAAKGPSAAIPSPQPAKARVAAYSRASAAEACADCGVVDVEGRSAPSRPRASQGSGLGAVAGGVVGGILGNQVGRGGGRTATTVVGAGAYAGHEIEKNMNKSLNYQIRVRMNDGTYRTFHERSQPALTVGQKVRVTNNGVVAAG